MIGKTYHMRQKAVNGNNPLLDICHKKFYITRSRVIALRPLDVLLQALAGGALSGGNCLREPKFFRHKCSPT